MSADVINNLPALVLVPGGRTPEDICHRLRRTMGSKMLQTFRQFIVDWPGIEATVGRLAEYVSDALAFKTTSAAPKPILITILADGLHAYEEALEAGCTDLLRFGAFVEACLMTTAKSLKGVEIREGQARRWTADGGAPLLRWLEESHGAGEFTFSVAKGCGEEGIRSALESFLLCKPDRMALKEARREWTKQKRK